VEKTLKNWAKAANIGKAVTFHTARHTFATMLLTKGGDLFTVSKLLGHKDISTTQVYAKIVDQKKNDTVNLLNDVF
jgi:site-specific recombinase XerD